MWMLTATCRSLAFRCDCLKKWQGLLQGEAGCRRPCFRRWHSENLFSGAAIVALNETVRD